MRPIILQNADWNINSLYKPIKALKTILNNPGVVTPQIRERQNREAEVTDHNLHQTVEVEVVSQSQNSKVSTQLVNGLKIENIGTLEMIIPQITFM